MPQSRGSLLLIVALAIPSIPLAQVTSQLPSYKVTTIAGTNLVGDGGHALDAQLSSVEGLAIDRSGNLYIADSTDHRVRKVTPGGIITTVVGNGSPGPAKPGLAAESQLNSPYGLALDATGNLYIADYGNAQVRCVTPDGMIRTVAGGGFNRISGEGADALGAKFLGPRNVAVDLAGNLYISDYNDHLVYKVTPGGKISVLAGTGTAGFNEDGSPVVSQLNFPAGLAVDRYGTVFIADSRNKRVRRVRDGEMTTVAGGPDASVQFSGPLGLALDSASNLYITDGLDNLVYRLEPFGAMTVVVGTESALEGPTRDIALDAHGMFYLADGRRVLRGNETAPPIPYAGCGSFGHWNDGGLATEAYLAGPIGVAVDGSGVYVAEEQSKRVRKIDSSGMIRTVAGGGTAPPGDEAPAAEATFVDPVSVAVDPSAGLRISDHQGNRIRGVLPGGTAFTVAGDGTPAFSGDGGPAQASRVNRPRGLAFDREGNVFFADSLNHRVRRIDTNGVITTVAGSGVRGFYGDGGKAVQAQLNLPLGVFVDEADFLYIADSGNHVIRRVSPAGIISTVAGSGARGSGGDEGPALLASFYSPASVVVDPAGNLFIADTFNHRIRRVSAAGIVTTIAGDGTSGFGGDGDLATTARFRSPAGLALDSAGRIYVADLDNNRIRVLTPIPVTTPEPPAPLISDLVVMNAASFRSGPVAPGELVSIFSEAIGIESTVRMDGRAMPASAIVAGQANSHIPLDVVHRREILVEIAQGGSLRAQGRVPVTAVAPGLFTVERGVGQVIAVHEDGTLNSAGNPAFRGSIVVLYATGQGELDAGERAKLPVSLKVGNSYAEVLYAGAAPGFFGLMQLNVRLPGVFTAPGTHAVTLTVGEVSSQPGVTITVR